MQASTGNTGFNHYTNNLARHAPKEVLTKLAELRQSFAKNSHQVKKPTTSSVTQSQSH